MKGKLVFNIKIYDCMECDRRKKTLCGVIIEGQVMCPHCALEKINCGELELEGGKPEFDYANDPMRPKKKIEPRENPMGSNTLKYARRNRR